MKKPKPEATRPQTTQYRGEVKPARYESPAQRPKPTPKPPKKK